METEDQSKLKKTGYRIVAPVIRKQAVEELESGLGRLADVALKYGVGEATVSNWRKQVLNLEGGPDPVEQGLDMERIANELLDGLLSEDEAMERYGFTKRHRLRYWATRIYKKNWTQRRKNRAFVTDIVAMKKPGGPDAVPKEDFALLVAELEAMRLRVAALETLIDVAEKETGLDIRKKGGSKRSRK